MLNHSVTTFFTSASFSLLKSAGFRHGISTFTEIHIPKQLWSVKKVLPSYAHGRLMLRNEVSQTGIASNMFESLHWDFATQTSCILVKHIKETILSENYHARVLALMQWPHGPGVYQSLVNALVLDLIWALLKDIWKRSQQGNMSYPGKLSYFSMDDLFRSPFSWLACRIEKSTWIWGSTFEVNGLEIWEV